MVADFGSDAGGETRCAVNVPWKVKDAAKKTKKAATPRKARQWQEVANALLAKGASEGSAIRQANGVVKNTR